MKKFVASILAGMVPSAAFSADAVRTVDFNPPVAPVVVMERGFDWTGTYAGAQVSGLWDVNRSTRNRTKLKEAQFLGGLYLGYNHQYANNLVTGLEIDVTVPKKKKADAVDPRLFGSARVRVGYAMDRFLPYVDGGLLVGQMEAAAPAKGSASKKTHFGFTVGAGVEYALTDHISARASYHYMKLRDADYQLVTGNRKVGFAGHTLGVGISYKF